MCQLICSTGQSSPQSWKLDGVVPVHAAKRACVVSATSIQNARVSVTVRGASSGAQSR
jgi:hypothetical protein